MKVDRRCPGCKAWYPKDLGGCPTCGEPPPRFNKFLATSRLNNQLFGQADHADKERRYADALGI